jgi:hypothetical protein
MWTHRLAGSVLASFGLGLLVLQLALLYGSTAAQGWMVTIGLPGTAVLSCLGAVCFSAGCLLAAAPKTTLHHARRAAAAMRRSPRP